VRQALEEDEEDREIRRAGERRQLDKKLGNALKECRVRAGQLGLDRHFNAYFWFPSDTAGLYVQPAAGEGTGWRVWGLEDGGAKGPIDEVCASPHAPPASLLDHPD